MVADLKSVQSHFRFGENWAEYAENIDVGRIEEAQRDLAILLGRESLAGLRFLDIGSGSGIHSLAALRMGACEVLAVDLDPQSVETTRTLLRRYAPNANWKAEQNSIFNMHPNDVGTFDIVYSWGVLHHTGAMYEAIRNAAMLVSPGGDLCIALYARTWLCGFWRAEKRIYSRSPRWLQNIMLGAYVAFYYAVQSLRTLRHGRIFRLHSDMDGFKQARGMSFVTDARDWLGGYPYESIAPSELRGFLATLGFTEKRSFIKPGLRHGLTGSGCDEYDFVRGEHAAQHRSGA